MSKTTLKRWYFTFGTSPLFPYFGGWVVVHAVNKTEAINKFNQVYPPRKGASGEIVNCSFIYPEEVFNEFPWPEEGNLGNCLHDTIF